VESALPSDTRRLRRPRPSARWKIPAAAAAAAAAAAQLYTRQRQKAKQPAEDEANRAEMKETALLGCVDVRSDGRGGKGEEKRAKESERQRARKGAKKPTRIRLGGNEGGARVKLIRTSP